MDPNKPTYESIIAVDSIPPLPATAATLLRMAADPDVEIEDLAMVIERDPALTARLIGIANSAFYAPRIPVVTVKDAIIRVLGLNLVRNMAFGMAMAGGFSTAACQRFDLTVYWLMALGTADMASGLARASTSEDVPDPDAVYLAGLMHNVGELLLAYLWPDRLNQALTCIETQPDVSLIDAQREVIGVDQWTAGALLARHWQLPQVVIDGIDSLGATAEAPGSPELGLILRTARRWVGGVVAGRPDTLRVDGVDEAYCEYRSSAFISRYDALKALAHSMGG